MQNPFGVAVRLRAPLEDKIAGGVEGNWKQFKGNVKEKWGKLTDDDIDVIEGKREQLEGKIQQRYGYAKDQVRNDVDDWFKTLK